MVKMQVLKVGLDEQGRPLVLLADEEQRRLLPIWVGPFEARAIATPLQGEAFPRPLTHDLLRSVIETLEYRLLRVEIPKVEDNTFYALLILDGPLGRIEIDARPSDAMALALRMEADIYVAEAVMDEAEEIVDPEEAAKIEKMRELLSQINAPDEGDEA